MQKGSEAIYPLGIEARNSREQRPFISWEQSIQVMQGTDSNRGQEQQEAEAIYQQETEYTGHAGDKLEQEEQETRIKKFTENRIYWERGRWSQNTLADTARE
jgi:hypothetical protein